MMGEDARWAYMDALHQNIAAYTHPGSKPCRQASAGEYAVGLSFEYRANKTKKDGAPIEIVLPKEGLGWHMEATAIMYTTKQPEASSRQRTLRRELRHRCPARLGQALGPGERRYLGHADQERLRLDHGEP
jgi:hypothetical protein